MVLNIILIIIWIIVGIINIYGATGLRKDYKVDLSNYIIMWIALLIILISAVTKYF